MLESLRQILNGLAKLFAGLFFKNSVEPTPRPEPPPPVPVPPPPTPTPTPRPVPPPPPLPTPIRTRPYLMRDSTNGFDIPVGTDIVAGYVDGLYAWTPAMWAHHRNSYQLQICVDPRHNVGHILDVEVGDARPVDAPSWVLMRRAAGHQPWVYVNASTWPQVRAAFHARGIAEPLYWIARWGPNHVIPPGAIALQYANPTITGHHYDESIVIPTWRGDMR